MLALSLRVVRAGAEPSAHGAGVVRVIPGGQDEVLGALLRQASPAEGPCRWAGASVEKTFVKASYSCGDAARVELELHHPEAPPTKGVVGKRFAVVVASGSPPQPWFTSLVDRLESVPTTFRWERRFAKAPMRAEAWCWLISLSMLLAPWGVGGLVGFRVGGSVSKWRSVFLTLWGAAMVAVSLPVAMVWPVLSVYDVAWVGAMFAFGLAVGVARARGALDAPRAVLASVSFALSVGALEAGARRLRVPLPDIEPMGDLHLSFSPLRREPPCGAMFPEASPGPWFVRVKDPLSMTAPPAGVVRVMHLGDSTTEGSDVPEEATFVARLQALRPGEEHVNLGVSKTGTDAHLVMLRQWLPRLRPSRVFLHVFPGNDVGEMNRPYACCDDGPLLEVGEGAPRARCEAPRWRFSAGTLLAQGPLPYPLRVVEGQSRAIRLANFFVSRGLSQRLAVVDRAGALDWAAFEASLRAIGDETRQAGARLTVVVLPVRMAFDGTDVSGAGRLRETTERVLGVSRKLGLETLDAAAYFEALHRDDPGAPLFKRDSNNSHLEVLGHERYALWLHGNAR